MSGTPARLGAFTWVAAAVGAYHLAVLSEIPAYLGFFIDGQVHLAISLGSALLLIFWSVPWRARHDGAARPAGERPPWFDLALIGIALVGTGYVVFNLDAVLAYGMYGELDTKGIALALCVVIPLVEALRRKTGWVLPAVIFVFVLGTIFQYQLPGLLYGKGYDADRVLFAAYVGNSGVFGLPLRVSATIVIVYLVFGALMDAAGAGRWFIDLAVSLTGWSRGGPAKAAVVSSALFGSISGSPSSNAATTGVFTIPMMVHVGYRPAFAAAVEAVASTGGQILPPVMGAIAFVMAEWIEVPYSTIVVAAFVPALLYYLIVFVSVHLQAYRDGVRALPRAEIPPILPALCAGWMYVIPIVVLVWMLMIEDMPPGMSAMYACAALVPVSFLFRDRSRWLTPRRIVQALGDGVRRWLGVVVITASVGIMIGALELSGVGIKLSGFIVELSGGNLYLALVLVGVASLIVGMGLDSIPAYITLATLMAPALVEMGVPVVAAHLFVIYWGLASFYTPPMCIVVYVTTAISGSRIWETGWEAVKLGIAAFVIPYAFAINQGLLLQGSPGRIALATSTAAIGSTLVACAVSGYLIGPIGALARTLTFVAGVLFIAPGVELPLAGLVVLVSVLAAGILRGGRTP